MKINYVFEKHRIGLLTYIICSTQYGLQPSARDLKNHQFTTWQSGVYFFQVMSRLLNAYIIALQD